MGIKRCFQTDNYYSSYHVFGCALCLVERSHTSNHLAPLQASKPTLILMGTRVIIFITKIDSIYNVQKACLSCSTHLVNGHFSLQVISQVLHFPQLFFYAFLTSLVVFDILYVRQFSLYNNLHSVSGVPRVGSCCNEEGRVASLSFTDSCESTFNPESAVI